MKHIMDATMDITEKIKSYEDACKVLGLNPENQPCVDSVSEKDRNSIIAYHKLIVIVRALNEGWEADFSDYGQCKYWIFLTIDAAGFVFAVTHYTASFAAAAACSRLCLKSRKLAEYAITQFKSLYEEYFLTK